MNQLLYNRAAGTLAPQSFARIQTTQLIRSIQASPRLRFDGGEKEVVRQEENDEYSEPIGEGSIWAHQAGASALAIDIDGRM